MLRSISRILAGSVVASLGVCCASAPKSYSYLPTEWPYYALPRSIWGWSSKSS